MATLSLPGAKDHPTQSRSVSSGFLGFRCGGLVTVAAMGLLEIVGAENLADFGGPFPSGPVLEVELHEFLCAFDGFLFGLEIEDGETADDFFSFGERAVSGGDFIAGDAHGRAGAYWGEAAIDDHCAGFDGGFAVDECLGWRAGKFACGFDQHHESHAVSPFWCSVESLVIPSQRPVTTTTND
jgi:hypothetical protein